MQVRRSGLWRRSHDAVLGDECIVGGKSTIAYDVKIGNRVKINSNVYICNGVTIEDGVTTMLALFSPMIVSQAHDTGSAALAILCT